MGRRLSRRAKKRIQKTRRRYRGGGQEENIEMLKKAGKYNNWVSKGSMWGVEPTDLTNSHMKYTNYRNQPIHLMSIHKTYPEFSSNSQKQMVSRILPVFNFVEAQNDAQCPSIAEQMNDMLEVFSHSLQEKLGPGFVSMGIVKAHQSGQGPLFTFGLDPCLALCFHIGTSVIMTHLHAISILEPLQAKVEEILIKEKKTVADISTKDIIAFGEEASTHDRECGRSLVESKMNSLLQLLGIPHIVHIQILKPYEQCVVDPDTDPWYRVEEKGVDYSNEFRSYD